MSRLLIALAIVLTVGSSVAQPSMAEPLAPVAPSAESRGYAKHIAIADGIGVAVLLSGLALDNGGVAVLGGLSLVLVSPALHLSKGHPGRGGLSLLFRVGLPLAGSIYAIDNLDEDVVLGGMLGGVAATALDLAIAHFGEHYENVPATTPVVGQSWAGTGAPTFGIARSF